MLKQTLQSIKADLLALKLKYNISLPVAFFSNRGFHALFIYRISHLLYRVKVPLIPLILTRIIQILYAIDIDYKGQIAGGQVIIHGVGLVIGEGVIIDSGCIIYHQVTLGKKGIITDLGFPIVRENCVLGAGAKLFGSITIGAGTVIGANTVITEDVAPNSMVKMIGMITKPINDTNKEVRT